MNRPAAIPDDYVLTPHGLRHKDDVRFVGEIEDRQPIDPPKHPPTEFSQLRQLGPAGWVVSAFFTPSEPLKCMSVTFTVPEAPTKGGALIYLFPGAEGPQLGTILQPVLQYGYNGLFGGNCWTLACWHCTPQGVTRYSRHIEVQPGWKIVGTIKILNYHQESCDWSIEARVIVDEVEVNCTILHAYNVEYLLLFLVAGALEAYSLENPNSLPEWNQYPESGVTRFHDIQLESLTGNRFRADWNTRRTVSDCGFRIFVSADKSAVTLEYQ